MSIFSRKKEPTEVLVRLRVIGVDNPELGHYVTNPLLRVPGVKDVQYDYASGVAQVIGDPKALIIGELTQAVHGAGYTCTLVKDEDLTKPMPKAPPAMTPTLSVNPDPFHVDVSDWLKTNYDAKWLTSNLKWKDFGNGSRIATLKRDGHRGMVLYHVSKDADSSTFVEHLHLGGEMYFILKGEVYDERGTYRAGSVVWMDAQTKHTPKTRGETLILVLWPGGVKNT